MTKQEEEEILDVLTEEEVDCILNNDRLGAIRSIDRRTGIGLKGGKDLVDKVVEILKGGDNDKERTDRAHEPR